MALVKRTTLLKAGVVARRMGVSTKTLENWSKDPLDDFPKPTKRNGKSYWVEAEVDAFIEAMVKGRDDNQAKVRQAMIRVAG